MIIQLSSLKKTHGEHDNRLLILSGLDLELRRGEVVAIVGESGTGKSTLLSLLAGFDRPDAGQVLWQGQNAGLWTDKEWAIFRRKNLGFVFQNYHLIPYLTAQENVALPLRLLNNSSADLAAKKMLEELGLKNRDHHLPAQLSGGESQRVAIGRALIHRPELVLADEPTGSLDAKTGGLVLGKMFELFAERQQSALIVTHSQEVADRCHRRLRLKDGRLWPA